MYRLSLFVLLLLSLMPLVSAKEKGSGKEPFIPPPARTMVFRTGEAIVADGHLDEMAWQKAPALSLSHRFLTGKGQPWQATRIRLLWDDTCLYVAFESQDVDIWASTSRHDGPLWEGEVVEVYLDPKGTGRHYKEIEVSPWNTVIDLDIPSPDRVAQWQKAARWECVGLKTGVSVVGTVKSRKDRDRLWTVEMAIPWKGLGVPKPHIGEVWRVQLYRIDRPKTGQPEFSAWSATDDFHRPKNFGYLTFAARTLDRPSL